MRKLLRLLLFAPLWIGCQSSDPAEFGIEPDHVAYNDDAALSKRAFCDDGKCNDPSYEERYTYTAQGALSKVEVFHKNASGKLEMQNYTVYLTDSNGRMVRKIEYGKHGTLAGWVTYSESEFEYKDGQLSSEIQYFNRHDPDQKVFTGIIEYAYENGKKVSQKWMDDKKQLYRRVAYKYRNNVVNVETWYDGRGEAIRIFEHKFSGNRRQISEYMPNSKEVLALVEKTYDEQGRLITQQTKVFNMLLCAMTPGLIKYSY